MSGEFSPDVLMDQAQTSTGLHDFGSDHFRSYLAAWCQDLGSPQLSEAGRPRLAKIAIRNLVTRLRIEDTLRRNPEILDTPLPRIVRIAGLPRSGTTLLHQLLSLRPERRALLRWELVDPVPPPEAPTYAADPRIEKVGKPLEALRGTDLERMHWVEASDPEECTWGFYDLSGLLGRGSVAATPVWRQAIFAGDRDHRQTYVEYRRLIQLLLWRNPLPPDGTLVLKCPTDNDCLVEFIEVFPEAAIAALHRDPFRIVTSSCRIQQVINAGHFADNAAPSEADYLATVLSTTAHQAEGLVTIASSHSAVIQNIRYADLMADPAAVVGRVEEQLGLPGAGESAPLVAEFLARQRSGARAAPPTDYGTFGATAELIRGEPSVARYIETFEVPSEVERVAAPSAGS